LQKYNEALQDLNQYIRLHPNEAEPYHLRAISKIQLQDINSAVSDLSICLDIQPDHSGALQNQAMAQYQLKNYPKAQVLYSKILTIEGNNQANTYMQRGLCYLALDDYKNALRDFDEAIAHDPKLAEAYFNRANVHKKLEQDKKACNDLQMAIKNGYRQGLAYENILCD